MAVKESRCTVRTIDVGTGGDLKMYNRDMDWYRGTPEDVPSTGGELKMYNRYWYREDLKTYRQNNWR